MMKYSKTWKAIDQAIEQSHNLSEYSTISRTVSYMRQYPADVDCIEWNLGVIAGTEMLDNPAAPIWNGVITIWNVEKKEVADAKARDKSPARLARTT